MTETLNFTRHRSKQMAMGVQEDYPSQKVENRISTYLSKKTKLELSRRIRSNTFVTITIRQFLPSKYGGFIRADPILVDKIACGLMSGIERRLRPKRSWRRNKRVFPSLFTIERGAFGKWHIHACVRRPPNVTLQQFEEALKQSCLGSEWILERRDVQEDRGFSIPYILKQGQDCILTEASIIPDRFKFEPRKKSAA